MFSIQMYGRSSLLRRDYDEISSLSSTLDDAVSKAKLLAGVKTYSWGKARGFRILDDSKRVVFRARV